MYITGLTLSIRRNLQICDDSSPKPTQTQTARQKQEEAMLIFSTTSSSLRMIAEQLASKTDNQLCMRRVFYVLGR